MKKIVNYFLKDYENQPLSIYKKTKVLVQSIITCIVVVLPIILMHIFSGKEWLVITSDILFVLLMILPLYLIKINEFEAAANLVIITVGANIILQNPVNDFLYNNDPTYYRCLETGTLFLASIILVALFAYRSYQLINLVGIGVITLVAHYFVIIHKYYNGRHTSDSIVFIITYVIILLLTGILAKFMLGIYRDLIQSIEKESMKVKRYNQDLEKEVTKRTQELEIQNEELRKVNHELDRFVYSVSHDLRAPIASTLGLIDISRKEKDEEQRGYYLELMHKSLFKLDGFIQDIINLSRNARLEVQKDEICFKRVIESVLQEHSFLENADKIEKIIQIHQEKPFYSDEKRLTVVLNNIVANSIRYSLPYNRTPHIEIKVNLLDTGAAIEIHDNGQGIAEEHLPNVFNMFYRANSNKTGSGLGLYIVKETVQKLNGSVRLTSRLGEGTSFFLTIPELR